MTSDAWTVLANYPSVFEAELAKAALETEGIRAMVQSHNGGAFGPGFQGPVPGGVNVLVPTADLDRAWQLVVER